MTTTNRNLTDDNSEMFKLLIDIWLDGFTSGTSTSIATFNRNTLDNAQIDNLTKQITDAIVNDPLAVEHIRTEIRERIDGINSTEKELIVKL